MTSATVTIPTSILIWGLGIVTLLITCLFGYVIYHIRSLEDKKMDKNLCNSNRDNIKNNFENHLLKIDNIEKKVSEWQTQNIEDHNRLEKYFTAEQNKLEKQLNNINSALSEIHDCVIKLSLKSKC